MCLCVFVQNEQSAETMCKIIGKSPVFDQCTKVMEWKVYRTWCHYDMCARKDTSSNKPLCVIVLALVRECAMYGIIVNWQEDVELFGLCNGA